MAAAILTSRAIHSAFADDADLAAVVELFVDEMPGRIAALEHRNNTNNMSAVRHAAHQLKGAAGSHGFPQITSYAARLEAAIEQGHPTEAVERALRDLLDVCRQVRAGAPQPNDGDAVRCSDQE